MFRCVVYAHGGAMKGKPVFITLPCEQREQAARAALDSFPDHGVVATEQCQDNGARVPYGFETVYHYREKTAAQLAYEEDMWRAPMRRNMTRAQAILYIETTSNPARDVTVQRRLLAREARAALVLARTSDSTATRAGWRAHAWRCVMRGKLESK